MALVRNVHDGIPAKREPTKIVIEVPPGRPAAPATVADASPAPYARYNKGVYRVQLDGSDYRVDMWGDGTKAWREVLRHPAAEFRLEESPVEFMLYRTEPGADANRDPATGKPVADRAAFTARAIENARKAREQLEAIAKAGRERWRKPA
ncbi:hypothetical protein PX554_26125 [Sphingomonas sp. H39-1-10]|uniref:hypothetical protein n=1 Tax=Sphingomonas pollutisoli TaxID=3030829 RepID=UPI0023B9138C|nr:hypothetical protein [Sphingomonas pollutisoli]MDF0491596.1 hypothetical protein [Sphingomonas pollutisoli]